ncbi:MAG TPA: CBS domain-containing protein [Anaeromyxobacteraceae bacterium]|nr:CBS domain-containing protein [Anaeromyxobacteraceae bacterium]
MTTLVSEAMNRAVVTVPPDMSMSEAAEVARCAHAEHLVVLDGEDLVGIVCTCDIEASRAGELVCDCMTVPVMTVRPDAPIEEAANTLADCDIGCVPVALGGLLLGTVGDAELARAGVGSCRERKHCHHRRGNVPHA